MMATAAVAVVGAAVDGDVAAVVVVAVTSLVGIVMCAVARSICLGGVLTDGRDGEEES